MERKINYKNVVECFNVFHNAVKSYLGKACNCVELVNLVDIKFHNKFYFTRNLKDRKRKIYLECGISNWLKEDKTELSKDYVLRYKHSLGKILKFTVYYTDNGNIDYSSKAYLYNEENNTFDIAIPIAYLLDEESFLDYILSNYNAKIDRNILTINY